MADKWVEVGVIGRAHGIRGELYVFFHNHETTLAVPKTRLTAWPSDAQQNDESRRDLKVARLRETPKGWLIFFENIEQREEAAALTNCRLFVKRESLPSLPEGEFYQTDLIGMTAVAESGETVGTIEGFFDNKAHDVCVIRSTAGEILVPFIPEVLVEIDEDGGSVVFAMPEGLPGWDE